MTRKKKIDRSAPPLPSGEYYDRPDIPYRMCITCWRYLTDDESYNRHKDQGHDMRNSEWYRDGIEIAKRVRERHGV